MGDGGGDDEECLGVGVVAGGPTLRSVCGKDGPPDPPLIGGGEDDLDIIFLSS